MSVCNWTSGGIYIFNLVFRGLDKTQEVLLTHGDSIDKVAESFKPIAQSQAFIAGISNEKLNLFGVQFHPEVDLTVNGKAMLKNFLFDICGLTGNFTILGREEQCIKYIKDTVGNNKVSYFSIVKP